MISKNSGFSFLTYFTHFNHTMRDWISNLENYVFPTIVWHTHRSELRFSTVKEDLTVLAAFLKFIGKLIKRLAIQVQFLRKLIDHIHIMWNSQKDPFLTFTRNWHNVLIFFLIFHIIQFKWHRYRILYRVVEMRLKNVFKLHHLRSQGKKH